MTVVLYRVDERLIHGQVVVGWSQLHAERIVVVDDDLAMSSWEQDLYTLGLPADLASTFISVADARTQLDDWRRSGERIIVLTRDLSTIQRLSAGGLLKGEEINIGGIHHTAGRRPVLPYVFLNDNEFRLLRDIEDTGASLYAQDVPTGRRLSIAELTPMERRGA